MENHIQQQINTVALFYLFLPCVELSSTARASVKCHEVANAAVEESSTQGRNK